MGKGKGKLRLACKINKKSYLNKIFKKKTGLKGLSLGDFFQTTC